MIQTFFKRQIDEIEKNLKWYGIALGLVHVLTAYVWFGNVESGLARGVCWSYFPYCESYQNFISNFVYLLYPIYLFLGLSVVLSFLFGKSAWGYFILIVASLLQVAVQISDYRFMGNYHYMHHFVSLIFLFMPEKTMMIKLFLVLCYFFSGLLRFDLEWLTGASLVKPLLWIPRWLMDWMLLSVIYLEVLFSWLLLSRRWFLQYSTLFAYFIFHAFSYFIVGYFFPLLMFLLLAIFFMDRRPFEWPRALSNWALLATFGLLNLYPHVFEPQSALHGRGRLLALNMFDAKADCRNIFYIRFRNKTVEYIRDPSVRSVRVRCDYTLVFDKAKKLCEEFQGQSDFIDIDMSHQVRKSTEEIFSHDVQFKEICGRPIKISWWGDLYQ